MILNPTVIANLLASYVSSGMLIYAAYYGAQILKHWNIESGDELQLVLERKTYLISTVLSFVFGLQLLSLFLYIFTADALAPLFVGAMCGAGTLNVNGFGYPTLELKILNFMLAGLWLVLNHADNQGYDYPLIKKKYLLLVVITPFIAVETVLESFYFLGMRADVITSCCGSLFSSEKAEGLGSEIASLPAKQMLWVFYGGMFVTLLSGLFFYVKRKGGYLYAGMSLAMFGISLVAIVSAISLYIYELPTHHCPFCIIMQDYNYIGYLLYVLLFGAVVAGMGSGLLLPFRGVASLNQVLDGFIDKLALASILLYGLFTALVSYEIISSSLEISYEVVY
ncbi:hypothetical protein QZJ86_08420 [Methylomonas montana]|uniref:hypothetical protein n=1 Tax=Methylomonas montana TaxID=3058963 RepID=UPI002657E48C|nr:hypothetical protein [Methylomonas montana]WKJ92151.1 hypothetical protein QZJ86_08420 [Methylomonas montana]